MPNPTTVAKAREARIKVLSMIHKAQTSHIASNFSIIDIATVLYENLKPEDRVVWSKGWAAASAYYFGVQRGDVPAEALEQFPNAPYLGLAETTVPGILCNGGAVGHGSPIAVGIAYAKKMKGEAGNVYCIMSDGELNEGSVWESAMFAAHHKLNNLIFIIDKNNWQAMGATKDVIDIDPYEAFTGFRFQTTIKDGHNHSDIRFAIDYANQFIEEPKALIFETVKGKGVSFMEDHLLYHYKNIDKETYEKALEELGVTVIKRFPGEAVDRHLKLYGHLPALGCCEHDQPKHE
jgi:transketolase